MAGPGAPGEPFYTSDSAPSTYPHFQTLQESISTETLEIHTVYCETVGWQWKETLISYSTKVPVFNRRFWKILFYLCTEVKAIHVDCLQWTVIMNIYCMWVHKEYLNKLYFCFCYNIVVVAFLLATFYLIYAKINPKNYCQTVNFKLFYRFNFSPWLFTEKMEIVK